MIVEWNIHSSAPGNRGNMTKRGSKAHESSAAAPNMIRPWTGHVAPDTPTSPTTVAAPTSAAPPAPTCCFSNLVSVPFLSVVFF